jgi:hypothetical protein
LPRNIGGLTGCFAAHVFPIKTTHLLQARVSCTSQSSSVSVLEGIKQNGRCRELELLACIKLLKIHPKPTIVTENHAAKMEFVLRCFETIHNNTISSPCYLGTPAKQAPLLLETMKNMSFLCTRHAVHDDLS